MARVERVEQKKMSVRSPEWWERQTESVFYGLAILRPLEKPIWGQCGCQWGLCSETQWNNLRPPVSRRQRTSGWALGGSTKFWGHLRASHLITAGQAWASRCKKCMGRRGVWTASQWDTPLSLPHCTSLGLGFLLKACRSKVITKHLTTCQQQEGAWSRLVENPNPEFRKLSPIWPQVCGSKQFRSFWGRNIYDETWQVSNGGRNNCMGCEKKGANFPRGWSHCSECSKLFSPSWSLAGDPVVLLFPRPP